MSRGNYRRTIFPDDDHVERYLFLLNRVVERRKWIVLDWCLMPNHYHLVVRLTDGGLSEGMRELNGCYSRWSNAVHELTGTGHLVRNRFVGRPVDSDTYFLALCRYLPLNPVRAQLASSPAGWSWSGFRANAGLTHPLPFHRPGALLEYFSPAAPAARRAYRHHVLVGDVSDGRVAWSDDNQSARG
jgi:putative transposase